MTLWTRFLPPARWAGRLCVSIILGLGWLASSAPPAVAQAPTPLTAYYDPATGNFKLQNTTASALQISSFNLLTLGNGSIGAATPNSLGYLSGATVNASSANPGSGISFAPTPASFRVSNAQASGSNGQFSQISAVLFFDPLDPAPLFTLNPYSAWSTSNPIGPAGTYWELGNVAATGMTQGNLDTRFLAEGTPNQFGKFAYGTFTGSGIAPANGNVVSVVPEPSTLAAAVVVLGGLGAWRFRRARRLAAG